MGGDACVLRWDQAKNWSYSSFCRVERLEQEGEVEQEVIWEGSNAVKMVPLELIFMLKIDCRSKMKQWNFQERRQVSSGKRWTVDT